MGGQGGHAPPSLFLKSYLVRDVFLEIRFYVIPQGIQNFLGPNTRRGPCLLLSYAVYLFQNKDLFEIFPFLSNNCRKTGKSVYCLPLFTRSGHWHGPKKKPAPNIKPFEKPNPKYRTGAKQKPDLIFRFEINEFTTENTIYFTTQNENF